MLNWCAQVLAVSKLSLQTLPERKGAALSAVFGIAGVVAVLVGVLSIAQGIRLMVESSGEPVTHAECVIQDSAGDEVFFRSSSASDDSLECTFRVAINLPAGAYDVIVTVGNRAPVTRAVTLRAGEITNLTIDVDEQ